ncbi:MAG: hypothetical protein JXQ27_16115 [Acidobacteria bacterium]|nr:hypothetical protein [Acidobacteriota bacterium]
MMSQPAVYPAPPPRRRHGCRNCCLLTLLLLVLLVVGFVVAGWWYFSEPAHPVEEEYETIPEYFGKVSFRDSKGTRPSPWEVRHG